MDDLLQQATDFLRKRYVRPVHTVAAALRTTDGTVYLGVNIDHFSGFVCAEVSALASAMNADEKSFVEIVAVRRESDGTIGVANPCGKCRQILHDFAPGIKIMVSDGGVSEIRFIEELLPFSFKRQRQKIQDVLNEQNPRGLIDE